MKNQALHGKEHMNDKDRKDSHGKGRLTNSLKMEKEE